MSLSNTAVPRYYGEFRDAVMRGDIPVNNDDEIEKEFLNFPAGTSKLDVWHWFDERCPNNLHDDLMFSQNDAVQI